MTREQLVKRLLYLIGDHDDWPEIEALVFEYAQEEHARAYLEGHSDGYDVGVDHG